MAVADGQRAQRVRGAPFPLSPVITSARSFWETEAFLKERQAYLAYTEEDFGQDRRDLDRLMLR
jgi:hypothetical protein